MTERDGQSCSLTIAEGDVKTLEVVINPLSSIPPAKK